MLRYVSLAILFLPTLSSLLPTLLTPFEAPLLRSISLWHGSHRGSPRQLANSSPQAGRGGGGGRASRQWNHMCCVACAFTTSPSIRPSINHRPVCCRGVRFPMTCSRTIRSARRTGSAAPHNSCQPARQSPTGRTYRDSHGGMVAHTAAQAVPATRSEGTDASTDRHLQHERKQAGKARVQTYLVTDREDREDIVT